MPVEFTNPSYIDAASPVVDWDTVANKPDIIPPPLELDAAPLNGPVAGYDVSGTSSPAMDGFYGPGGTQGGRDRFACGEYSLAWNSGFSLYEFRDGSSVLKWYSGGGEEAPEDVEEWFSAGGASGTPALEIVPGTTGVPGQMAHYPGGISECKSASPITWFPIPNSDEVIHQ